MKAWNWETFALGAAMAVVIIAACVAVAGEIVRLFL